jgi:hypothetical protein
VLVALLNSDDIILFVIMARVLSTPLPPGPFNGGEKMEIDLSLATIERLCEEQIMRLTASTGDLR